MPQFIQVEDKLINLQFIKCIRLSYGILEVTVPEPGGGEVVHFIREGGTALFERLKGYCVNCDS